MKIDLSTIDRNSFYVKEGIIGGKCVFLINPVDFDCKWTMENLCFRSMIVDESGLVLSMGFPKFFNATEKPELYPNPENFNDWVLTNKEDGSLVCVDLIYDVLNVRTRGTISFTTHENVSGFNYIIDKYNLYPLVCKYPQYTFLFEMYDPDNVIVIKKYDKPEIVFLGAMDKESGKYIPFYSDFGKDVQKFLNCLVPEIYVMNGNVVELMTKIKEWSGKEGVVLKYNQSQNQIKIKSDWYLRLHKLKSVLANINNVIDVWFEQGKTDYDTFYKFIETTFDFEIAEQCKETIKQIINAYKIVCGNIAELKKSIEPLKTLPRKDAAITIIQKYPNDKSICFALLDNKDIDDKMLKKLMFSEF
jgi:T4 RnlA family RNA ligase